MDTLQAVARILKMEGVEWVSCFPSNNLLEAVAAEGIRPLLFRHERGAVMAADGFSRLNDRQKFGVVITQGGPGAENSMGGIAQAYADNVPILVFQGGVSTQEYAVRPNFSPVRTYQSVTRHAEVIWKPDMVSAVMRRAFHALRNGRPGPVLIEIPSDVDRQEVPEAAQRYQPPDAIASGPLPRRGQGRGAARCSAPASRSSGPAWAPCSPRRPTSCASSPSSPRSRSTARCPASRASTSGIPWRSAPAAAPRPCRPTAGSRSRTCCSRSAPA